MSAFTNSMVVPSCVGSLLESGVATMGADAAADAGAGRALACLHATVR